MPETRQSQTANHGRLLIMLAAILWSTSGLFAKAPIFDEWTDHQKVMAMVFWRTAFASCVLLFLVRRIQWSWKLVPMTTVFAAMNWAFVNAMIYADPTTAIWLQYTAPAFVLLASVLWLKEKFKREEVWFLACALGGLAIILGFQIGQTSSRGLMYGCLAGVFYAGVILSLRNLRDFDSAWLIFLNHVVTTIVFLPGYLQQDIAPKAEQWIYLSAFGILQLGIPYVLFARGLKSVVSHEASLILLLEPILVPVWVFIVWRNADNYSAPAWSTLLGATLIFLSLAVRYSRPLWRKRPPSQENDSE